MSLTTGRGPLGADPAGRFSAPIPSGIVYVEPFQRRVRGLVAGTPAVDSERAVLVHRAGRYPSLAFPTDDVDEARLGDARVAPEPAAPGHVVVPWDAVDAWFEEEAQLHGHPRNPYHRVDCIPTSRRLVVKVEGLVLVDTTDTMGVYETALDPKLYARPAAVRMDLLERSPTTTYCPYKGTASYWSARVGDALVADVAWSYDDPLPESLPIAGLLSFDGQRASVDAELPAAR